MYTWNHSDRPYQNLPPLPPVQEVTASRALATLRGATELLPDPTMLVNFIPLLEVQASSEIENIVTTDDEVFRAAHKATK